MPRLHSHQSRHEDEVHLSMYHSGIVPPILQLTLLGSSYWTHICVSFLVFDFVQAKFDAKEHRVSKVSASKPVVREVRDAVAAL